MRPTSLLPALAVCLITSLPAMAACGDPAGPGVNWSGCSFEFPDLTGANLDGANLSGADITGANLTYATLRGANLSGATIRQVTLDGTDFAFANFTGATFDQVYMGLGGALERSNGGYVLYGVSTQIAPASFRGANFTNANLIGSLNFWGADLNGAIFSGVDLARTTWSNGDTCSGTQLGVCGPVAPLTCFYNEAGTYTLGHFGNYGGSYFEVVHARDVTPPAAAGDYYWALQLDGAYPGCPGSLDLTANPPLAVCTRYSDRLCQDTEPFRDMLRETPNFTTVATPVAPRPQQPQFGASVPSEDFVVASVGAQTDVTDFALINDTTETLYIGWIDGNGTIGNPPSITPPGQSWVVSNGAMTWESHWYAISTDYGFQCSISLRQGAQVNLSDLQGCRGIGFQSGGTGTATPAPQADIDFSLVPTYGGTALTAGFLPDPHEVTVYAGGSVFSSDAISGCNAGYIDAAQSYRLSFTATNNPRLTISLTSDADTTLVINDGQGNWICNDDSDGLNPAITFEPVASGDFNIWVGTFGTQGQFPEAILSVTEY